MIGLSSLLAEDELEHVGASDSSDYYHYCLILIFLLSPLFAVEIWDFRTLHGRKTSSSGSHQIPIRFQLYLDWLTNEATKIAGPDNKPVVPWDK